MHRLIPLKICTRTKDVDNELDGRAQIEGDAEDPFSHLGKRPSVFGARPRTATLAGSSSRRARKCKQAAYNRNKPSQQYSSVQRAGRTMFLNKQIGAVLRRIVPSDCHPPSEI